MIGTRDHSRSRARQLDRRRCRAARDRAGSARGCGSWPAPAPPPRSSASTTPEAVRGQRRAQEPPHLRLVLDHQHQRAAPLMRGAPRGSGARPTARRRRSAAAVSRNSGAAARAGSRAVRSSRRAPRRCRGRSPARAPPPARRRARPRTNFSKSAPRLGLGQPGPAIGDLDLDARRARRARRSSIGVPGGRVLGRVLEQVDEHLLEQHRVDRDERQVGGQIGRDRRGPASRALEPRQRRADDLLERHPLPLHLERPRLERGSCRAGCRPAARAARPPRRSSRAARLALTGVEAALASRSVVAAPVIAASGVRRSCETVLSSALRIASTSPLPHPQRDAAGDEPDHEHHREGQHVVLVGDRKV